MMNISFVFSEFDIETFVLRQLYFPAKTATVGCSTFADQCVIPQPKGMGNLPFLTSSKYKCFARILPGTYRVLP